MRLAASPSAVAFFTTARISPRATRAEISSPAFTCSASFTNLPDRSRPDTINPRTGNRYSKVTAETIGELLDWARLKLPALGRIGDRNYCKTCTPTDDSPIESAPTADLAEYALRADQMRARGRVKRPEGILKPNVVQGTAALFLRDPRVRAWVLQRADGWCELCGAPAPFLTEHEEPFLETHHLVMLSEGGPDTPNNTAALCPNCHRNLHYGIDRMELRERLARVVTEKEAPPARNRVPREVPTMLRSECTYRARVPQLLSVRKRQDRR